MSFPGGIVVETELAGHRIRTDQPSKAGGTGSAPAPFDLFLASIGTCAGFYALRFCQKRSIDTRDLGVRLETRRDEGGKRIDRVRILVDLPAEFPEKYRAAIVRAIDQCAVKRHIVDPPEFAVETSVSAPAWDELGVVEGGLANSVSEASNRLS